MTAPMTNIMYIIILLLFIQHGFAINNFLDIEIYSRGLGHTQINNKVDSFIKINGESVISSFVGKGFNAIILNETTGQIMNQIHADTHGSVSTQDPRMSDFLANTTSPNSVIIITTYKSFMQKASPPISTLLMLESYGCLPGTLSSVVEDQDAFIFIGTPNQRYTFCNVTNKNGSAILQSFHIPLSGLSCIVIAIHLKSGYLSMISNVVFIHNFDD